MAAARKRRSPGEGSVWPSREKKGRGRWAIGDPSLGTRRRGPAGEKWFTKKAAQDALRAKLVDAARGELVEPSRQQLAGYLAEWLDGLRLAPSTVASYRKNVRLHITPYMGTVPLASLTLARLTKLYVELEAGGRRDGTGELTGGGCRPALSATSARSSGLRS